MPKRTYAVHIMKRIEGYTIPSTVFVKAGTAIKAREIAERVPSTVSVDSIDVDNHVKGAIER